MKFVDWLRQESLGAYILDKQGVHIILPLPIPTSNRDTIIPFPNDKESMELATRVAHLIAFYCEDVETLIKTTTTEISVVVKLTSNTKYAIDLRHQIEWPNDPGFWTLERTKSLTKLDYELS